MMTCHGGSIRGLKIFKLSQAHYIEKLLKIFNMFETTPISTPMDPHVKLRRHDKEPVSQLAYLKVIGSLMYAMTCTRPDIAFAVAKLSRFTSNPGPNHWTAIKRVLKYLKATMGCGITYSGEPPSLGGLF